MPWQTISKSRTGRVPAPNLADYEKTYAEFSSPAGHKGTVRGRIVVGARRYERVSGAAALGR